jgi:hypothetical protein
MYFEKKDIPHLNTRQKQTILGTAQRAGYVGGFSEEACKAALDYVASQAEVFRFPWQKDMRPHDIAPELKNIVAPSGDFTVGVEIEHPIKDEKRKQVVEFLKQFPYVTIDSDGGWLFEVTFPVCLLSQVDDKWGPYQYSRFLKEIDACGSYTRGAAGIHVNMGTCDADMRKIARTMGTFEHSSWGGGPAFQNGGYPQKFWNRNPYGDMYAMGGGRWYEMKMFKTTTDVDMLGWYLACGAAIMIGLREGANTKAKLQAVIEEAYNSYWATIKAQKSGDSADIAAAAVAATASDVVVPRRRAPRAASAV